MGTATETCKKNIDVLILVLVSSFSMVGGKSFSYQHGSQEFGLTGPIVMVLNVHIDIL
jgi:hypothetical protein